MIGPAGSVPQRWEAIRSLFGARDILLSPVSRGSDMLAFVADDDVWIAAASGGTARRLTSDRAPAAYAPIARRGSPGLYQPA